MPLDSQKEPERRRAALAAIVLLAGLVGSAGAAARIDVSTVARVPASPAFLQISRGSPTSQPSGGLARGPLEIVWHTLSPRERAEWVRAADLLRLKLELAHNPLVEDLEPDLNPRGDLERLFKRSLPALTAASGFVAGEWSSHDQSFVVRVVGECSPGAECVPLHGTGARATADEDRARFFAWATSYAVVLRVREGTDVGAPRVASDLRAAVDSATTHIGLVVSGAELVSSIDPQLVELGRIAERIDELLPDDASEKRELAALLPRGEEIGRAVGWWTLPTDTIVVVPRLGAITAIPAFVEEVRALVGRTNAPLVWEFVPGALR